MGKRARLRSQSDLTFFGVSNSYLARLEIDPDCDDFSTGFFGINDEYLRKVLWEEIFQLTYHGKYCIQEIYNLPIGHRKFLLWRLAKEYEMQAEQAKKNQNKTKSR